MYSIFDKKRVEKAGAHPAYFKEGGGGVLKKSSISYSEADLENFELG